MANSAPVTQAGVFFGIQLLSGRLIMTCTVVKLAVPDICASHKPRSSDNPSTGASLVSLGEAAGERGRGQAEGQLLQAVGAF